MNGLAVLAGVGTFTVLCLLAVRVDAYLERWWR